MPIERSISGPSADVTLHRAATNGERHVVVVGDFNDWSPDRHPMAAGPGAWTCTLTLPVGRRYRFRYLLDGERWENDWQADDYVDNHYGGQDSVIDLTIRSPDAT
jgi:1,4-alpha-glucan branching enzyme